MVKRAQLLQIRRNGPPTGQRVGVIERNDMVDLALRGGHTAPRERTGAMGCTRQRGQLGRRPVRQCTGRGFAEPSVTVRVYPGGKRGVFVDSGQKCVDGSRQTNISSGAVTAGPRLIRIGKCGG